MANRLITVATAFGKLNFEVELPDKCPMCHHAIVPQLHTSVSFHPSDGPVWVAYGCTNNDCLEMFVGKYRKTHNRGILGSVRIEELSLGPRTAQVPQVPELVAQLSPLFVEIYSQAEEANSEGLDQLYGIGLRKALEFLIKDFAKHVNPEKVEAIQKAMLGPCIESFINNERIKQTAKRAAWLGNDETHYIRKWETKDVSDLLTLVKLAMNYVDSELQYAKYIDEMPPG